MKNATSNDGVRPRLPYEKPRLSRYGDFRTLTQTQKNSNVFDGAAGSTKNGS